MLYGFWRFSAFSVNELEDDVEYLEAVGSQLYYLHPDKELND